MTTGTLDRVTDRRTDEDTSEGTGHVGGRGWRIGAIGGIPIRLDPSWIWIALLYTYTLYVDIQRGGAVVGQRAAIALALLSAALFFGSVLVHELAHAATARGLGIDVAGITLVFWGGFTETRAEHRGPGGEFLVSIAGPVSSLLLGGLYWGLSRATAASSPPISETLGWLGLVNVALAGLNAVPGFPLDGGRALLAAVWKATGSRRTATRVAGRVGFAIGAALLGLAALILVGVLRAQAIFAIYGLLIGWWMISAARSSERRLAVRDVLAGGVAAEAMSPPPPAVPADLSLSDALDRYLRGHEHESFPVVADGRVVGMISFRSARRVGAGDPLRPVRDAMTPIREVRTVRPTDSLDRVLDALGTAGAALVLDGETLAGSIGSADLEAWLRDRGRRSTPATPVPPRPDR